MLLIAQRADAFTEESRCLRENGYSVTDNARLSDLMQPGAVTAADMVIVDETAFEADPYQGLAQMRQRLDAALIVVARTHDEVDEIVALELGADDYIARPFSPRKLLARLRTLKRRRESIAMSIRGDALAPVNVEFGALQLDRSAFKATWHGRALVLSSINFETLLLLALRAPSIVTRGEVFARLHRRTIDLNSRAVDMFVLRLRKQLQAQGVHGLKVITVRGQGYRLELD